MRNLRAMFENKQADEGVVSPPASRGRSSTPVKRDSNNNTTNGGQHTPTALNKVRTNFVAVKNSNTNNTPSPPLPSDTTLAAPVRHSPDTAEVIVSPTDTDPDADMTHRRRDSFSLHDELPLDHKGIVERKKSIAEEFAARAHSLQIGETIPEFAVETPALETPAVDGNRLRHQLGYTEPPGVKNTANPDAVTKAQEPGTKLAESDPKSEKAVSDGKALEGASIEGLKGDDAEKLKTAANGKKVTPNKTPVHPSSRPNVTSRTPTGPAVTAAKKSPPITPGVSRSSSTRNTTSKPLNTTANGASKPSSSRPASSAPAAKKPAASSTAPSASGFVKPKPRSPTRPARLPASLMAPTASSLQKTGASGTDTLASSARRGSGGSVVSTKPPADRAPSRSLHAPKPAHTRPSLGPPPKKKDEQELRRQNSRSSMAGSAKADDSFLARMMRPTTASKGKVHDKPGAGGAGVSPPKPKIVHPHKAEQHAEKAVKSDAHKPVVTKAELGQEEVKVEAPREEPKPESVKVEEPKPESPKKDAVKSEQPEIKTTEPEPEPAKDEPTTSTPTKAEPIITPVASSPATTESPKPERRKLSSGFLPIPKIQRKKKPEEAKEEPSTIVVPSNATAKGHQKQRSSVSVMSEAIPEEEEEADLEDKPATTSSTPKQSMSPRKTAAKKAEIDKIDKKKLVDEVVAKNQERLDERMADAAVAAVEEQLKSDSSEHKNSKDLTKSETEEVVQQLETFRLTEEGAEKAKAEADAAASVDAPSSSNTAAEKTDADKAHENQVIDAAFKDAKAEYEKEVEMKEAQSQAQSSGLTSDMLTGSALASDDDITPIVEKSNFFDSQGKSGQRVSSAVSPKTGPLKAVLNVEQAQGEVDSESKKLESLDGVEEGNALEEEIEERDEKSKEEKAKKGELFVEGEREEMRVADKVEEADVTALAS